MGPKARRQNPQNQPLTTALRKICEDYPAGAGVLRELLQNADDAGASTIEFVLDTKSHPVFPLLEKGLDEYQGPSLLAYNDSTFKETDWKSIASIGDSEKLKDKIATGKYGLGFNSIYNWTDSPSVLSDNILLLLDPHHSWSAENRPPGGPDYLFTDYPDDEEMQNQLHAFSSINRSWNKPFNGTIIRIPLRNATHAKKSKIRSVETTAADIQNTMKSFADEMGTFGLLFLKSIRRIVFKVDDEFQNIIEISSASDLSLPKLYLEDLVSGKGSNFVGNTTPGQSEGTGQIYHEAIVKRESPDEVISKTYGVFHLMGHPNVDAELMGWAERQKLYPWVAVAARLDDQRNDKPEAGKLFSVLPLSIATGLKVQIHGLFSLSADRSRLHGLEDSGVHDKRPERWNQFLFNSIIPEAWAMLYSHICRNHFEGSFRFYELSNQSDVHLWRNINEKILDVVCRKKLEVWPSFATYENGEQAVFTAESTNTNLIHAMKTLKVLAVVVEDDMRRLVTTKLPRRILCPRLLFDLAKTVKVWPSLSEETNSALLQYFFPHIGTGELAHLPIFPFEDGMYRPLTTKTFIHRRNSEEQEFFERAKDCNLDSTRIPTIVHDAMHNMAEEGTNVFIRYRSSADLRHYFLRHIADEDSDIISPTNDIKTFIQKTWQWIKNYEPKNSDLKELQCLWLLPLKSGRLRRLAPREKGNSLTLFNGGGVDEVACTLLDLDPKLGKRIICNDSLDERTLRRLLSLAKNPCYALKNGNLLQGLAIFLKESARLLSKLPDEELGDCHRVLKETFLAQARSEKEREVLTAVLRSIPIFPEMSWNNINGPETPARHLVSLLAPKTFYGLKKLIPLPSIETRGVIDATNEETSSLLAKTGLATCLDEIEIVNEFVVPAANQGWYGNVPSDHRLNATKAIFQNFNKLTPGNRKIVPRLCIVPKANTASTQPVQFASCEGMIDPQSADMKDLFFEHEIFWPDSSFHAEYSAILKECGLADALNEKLAAERITVYASAAYDVKLVEQRVKSFLSLQIPGGQTQNADYVKLARSLRWLPARNLQGQLSLYTVDECRDSSWNDVARYVMPILQFKIHRSWENVLGWRELSSDLLISQLEGIITYQEWPSLAMTLKKLSGRANIAKHTDSLRELSFVQSNEGTYISPLAACRRDAERLSPYLSNVDGGFWLKHEKILKLVGIPDSPDLPRLMNVQETLEAVGKLDDAQIDISIAVATLWAQNSFDVSELRLPDCNGLLQSPRELVVRDVHYSTDCERPVLHEKVSNSLSRIVGIEPVSALIEKQVLSITDEEDEFDQYEDVADGIRDTLSRYSTESTFHEYIANADDCGSATRVDIMFDGKIHGQEKLLTPAMGKWQGPALLIHNDGVFTVDDFEGFKHVGRGSKRDNAETIGKFGRGSQTMFHWTDVPMILSGEFLLILDPLRRDLPYNYRTRQNKPGVKISIEKIRMSCPDQLAPFEGLWGFESSQNQYEGTIFRFPLRNMNESSELLEIDEIRDVSFVKQSCSGFFSEAQISLLFIRNIETVNYSLRADRSGNASVPVWSVTRGKWPEDESISDWADIRVCKYDFTGQKMETTQRYFRYIEDVTKAALEKKLSPRLTHTMKTVECGLAALVPHDSQDSSFVPDASHRRFFNCLPLKFASMLPLHVHATFLLSGDRQNISTETTTEESGSQWNRWLLIERIPEAYLCFLGDLGRRIGPEIYRFFPEAPSSDPRDLSQIVATAFWSKLSSSLHSVFPQEKPENAPGIVLNIKKQGRLRRPKLLFRPKHALFDLLGKNESEALRPLLSRCEPSFVKPPLWIAKILKDLQGLSIVTPAKIRDFLKIDSASQILEDMRGKHEAHFSIVLNFITPHKEDDITMLDKCKVLPLADGTLAKLSLKSEPGIPSTTPTYFYATDEDLSIFSFAARYITVYKSGSFISKVLNSEQFNLRAFQKTDAPHLLNFRDDWQMNEENKKWTFKFWQYMHQSSLEQETAPSTEDFLSDYPLLILTDTNDTEFLESFKSFAAGPAVVLPHRREDQRIVKSIPGLRTADPDAIPEILLEEEDLREPNSMQRLVKSMKMLAKQTNQDLADFAKSCLDHSHRMTLRAIFRALRRTGHYDLELYCNLPFCESFSTGQSSLTPAEALSAENLELIQPFMKDYQFFTKDKEFLHNNSILSTKSIVRDYILKSLPQSLPEPRSSYIQFLTALSLDDAIKSNTTGIADSLKNYALAPRQDGTLCLTSSLYDSFDDVFAAAFADKATTSFLIHEPQISLMADFWNELGLRRRSDGLYQAQHYLACLEELQSIIALEDDGANLTRVNKILNPLCSRVNTLVIRDDSEWQSIRQLALFPVTRNNIANEPEYRQEQMQALATARAFKPLREVVPRAQSAICWSQLSFVHPEPAEWALIKCNKTVLPYVHTVWDHLNYLSKCAAKVLGHDKEKFLDDVDKTYGCLQKYLPSTTTNVNIPEGAIWLNIEDRNSVSLEDLKSSWVKIEHLILESPCDAPPLRTVGPYLAKYSSLLEAAGCQKIFYPPIQRVESQEAESLLSILGQFRNDSVLVDVTFEAKDFAKEYRKISAHKLVLAAKSEYCKAKFYGLWATQVEASEPIIEKAVRFEALEVMIDFCYSCHEQRFKKIRVDGTQPIRELENRLNTLIAVLAGTDLWLMTDLHRLAEKELMQGCRYFIRPDNVTEVRDRAESAHANQVVEYCKNFEARNAPAIALAMRDRPEEEQHE